MHLALPTRKSSHPPAYANRSSRYPMLRRSRVQAILIGLCAVGALLFLCSHIFGGGERIPSGTPPVVIVTVVDEENYSSQYIKNIKENRIEYARKHGKKHLGAGKGRAMLIMSRLHYLLPNYQGLRSQRLSSLMDPSPSSPARIDKVSLYHLCLVS